MKWSRDSFLLFFFFFVSHRLNSRASNGVGTILKAMGTVGPSFQLQPRMIPSCSASSAACRPTCCACGAATSNPTARSSGYSGGGTSPTWSMSSTVSCTVSHSWFLNYFWVFSSEKGIFFFNALTRYLMWCCRSWCFKTYRKTKNCKLGFFLLRDKIRSGTWTRETCCQQHNLDFCGTSRKRVNSSSRDDNHNNKKKPSSGIR